MATINMKMADTILDKIDTSSEGYTEEAKYSKEFEIDKKRMDKTHHDTKAHALNSYKNLTARRGGIDQMFVMWASSKPSKKETPKVTNMSQRQIAKKISTVLSSRRSDDVDDSSKGVRNSDGLEDAVLDAVINYQKTGKLNTDEVRNQMLEQDIGYTESRYLQGLRPNTLFDYETVGVFKGTNQGSILFVSQDNLLKKKAKAYKKTAHKSEEEKDNPFKWHNIDTGTTAMFFDRNGNIPSHQMSPINVFSNGELTEDIIIKRLWEVAIGDRKGRVRSPMVDSDESSKKQVGKSENNDERTKMTASDVIKHHLWYIHPNESDIKGRDTIGGYWVEPMEGMRGNGILVLGNEEQKDSVKHIISKNFTAEERDKFDNLTIRFAPLGSKTAGSYSNRLTFSKASDSGEDYIGSQFHLISVSPNYVTNPSYRTGGGDELAGYNKRVRWDDEVTTHELVHMLRHVDDRHDAMNDIDIEEAMTDGETQARKKKPPHRNYGVGYYSGDDVEKGVRELYEAVYDPDIRKGIIPTWAEVQTIYQDGKGADELPWMGLARTWDRALLSGQSREMTKGERERWLKVLKRKPTKKNLVDYIEKGNPIYVPSKPIAHLLTEINLIQGHTTRGDDLTSIKSNDIADSITRYISGYRTKEGGVLDYVLSIKEIDELAESIAKDNGDLLLEADRQGLLEGKDKQGVGGYNDLKEVQVQSALGKINKHPKVKERLKQLGFRGNEAKREEKRKELLGNIMENTKGKQVVKKVAEMFPSMTINRGRSRYGKAEAIDTYWEYVAEKPDGSKVQMRTQVRNASPEMDREEFVNNVRSAISMNPRHRNKKLYEWRDGKRVKLTIPKELKASSPKPKRSKTKVKKYVDKTTGTSYSSRSAFNMPKGSQFKKVK